MGYHVDEYGIDGTLSDNGGVTHGICKMDAVIGVEAGNDLIWVKPYKKAPLRDAKRKYEKHDYQMLTVE